MFSFLLFTLIMVLGSAQTTTSLLCDPLTEYPKDGKCCKMCAPGKRMTSSSSCEDPVCVDCGDNEYQDCYNTDEKCKRQPYCDPNRNFEYPVPVSRIVRNTCLCKQGFHCSSKECITCVQHTNCQPGEGLVSQGTPTQDTVCRPCSDRTFSRTENSECEKWTECAEGFRVVESGTDRSDTVCEESRRDHIIIGVMVGVLGLMIIAGIVVYKYFKKSTYEVTKPLEIVQVETVGPAPYQPYCMPIECDAAEMLLDTDDEDDGKTENGNCLAQEDGKPEQLSRQESQSQPSSYTTSISTE